MSGLPVLNQISRCLVLARNRFTYSRLLSCFPGKFVQGISKRFQDEIANAATVSEESVSNIRTVRSFSQERKSMRHYGEAIEKSYQLGAKLAAGGGK